MAPPLRSRAALRHRTAARTQAAVEQGEAVALRGLMALPRPVQRRLAGRPVVLDGQVLDTEVQWLLRLRKLVRQPAVETLSVPEGRRMLSRQSVASGGRQPIGEVRHLRVPGADGPLDARLYTPRSLLGVEGPHPMLVFIHGGGMIYGDLAGYDPLCRMLAERAGVLVLSLTYRLAPEHPFPAGVDDVWTSYQWVTEHAEELDADPERIAVGGDSAGGYLSAVVALKAAEAGVPCAWQLLLYPVTNMADPSESRRMFGRDFILTSEFMDLAETSYVPAGVDRSDPLVSVAHTEKIPENLAPAYVVTAGFDPLRDEGEAWARRLADSGVDVRLKRFPGLIHGFAYIIGVGRSCRAATAEVAAQLKAALHPDSSA